MPKKPKIAEVRADMCRRVGKCSTLDWEKLELLLAVLEANRRMHYLAELTEADKLMCDRYVLLNIVLHSHAEDVGRMLSWCRAVMHERVKRDSAARNR